MLVRLLVLAIAICTATMAEESGGGDGGLQTIAETTGQFGNNFLKFGGANSALARIAFYVLQVKAVANDNPGNLITSPLSAQVVLAMAAYGAGGTTASQMCSALFIPSDNELGQSGYRSIIESLNSVTGVDLRLANKVYIASQFVVKPGYKELTAGKFLSASQELDFNNPAAAATTINTWCEEQTNKRIKDVISPDAIGPDTKLVLVNAVYFKGRWKTKFNPLLTIDRPFHINENTTRSIPTMYVKSQFRYGNLPQLEARFIELLYQGGQVSMIIILPNEVNGLRTVMDNLSQLNLTRSLQHAHPRRIELFLPKFKIESTLQLKNTLEKLGMTDMFTNHANFSGMADTQLKISKVIQKAFIEVNEEGSEAAAVTAAIVTARSSVIRLRPTPTFRVDRPYHYTIYHRNTGISLFTGIVEEPNIA